VNAWISEKVDGIWGEPKSMGHPFTSNGDIYASGLVIFKKNNSGYNKKERIIPYIVGKHPAISPAGDYIIFSNRANDGFGGTDLYVIFKKDDDSWSVPINLGNKINTKNVESSPTISGDGNFLFFSKDGDIYWVSTKIIEQLSPKE